ENGRHKHAVV
ncbi:hypothetical protein D039_0819B, partial [Vibrio parahaemolyticus EKP-028]